MGVYEPRPTIEEPTIEELTCPNCGEIMSESGCNEWFCMTIGISELVYSPWELSNDQT